MATRSNRTARAYDFLMEGVLNGRWHAGDTLSTYALADELGISRTPILEALKRLESEGLVEIIPQVGCRIVRPTPAALEELLSVRAALEALAAAGAARHIDDAALVGLEVALRRLEEAARRGDRVAHDELNQRFHLDIVEASGMPRLVQAARTVWAPLRYQLARLPVSDEALVATIGEHGEIVEALRRHAPRRAAAAAERHVQRSTARLLAGLDPIHHSHLVHRALVYRGDEEFLAASVPFVQEGLAADERVLAVTTERNDALLRQALGGRADEVEFRDAREWYALPSHTLLSYQRYVEQADRDRVRVLGEVAWGGDSQAPMSEWTRYESMLNDVFAAAPVTFLCPYDAGALPGAIVADARRTHPELCCGSQVRRSDDYTDVARLTAELDREPLPEPRVATRELPIVPDLRQLRGFVLEQAHAAGVSGKALQDAFLAVQEVATHVLAQGTGQSTVRSWGQDGELFFEVRDHGPGAADAFAGAIAADPAFVRGLGGLWLARLLCDLVEVRSDGETLVVRLHVALR